MARPAVKINKNKLQAKLAEIGMTQKELAHSVGMTDVCLCRALSKRRISPKNLIRISKRLNLAPEYLSDAMSIHTDVSDLISRQAAIKAFYCADELIVGGEANARNVVNYINKVVGKIENLPSAQPEIIRCKDCKYMTEHYDTDGNAPYWTCSEWDSGTDYDGFCHYAERRTDE